MSITIHDDMYSPVATSRVHGYPQQGMAPWELLLAKSRGPMTTTLLQSALWHRCPRMLGTATLLLCTHACLYTHRRHT